MKKQYSQKDEIYFLYEDRNLDSSHLNDDEHGEQYEADWGGGDNEGEVDDEDLIGQYLKDICSRSMLITAEQERVYAERIAHGDPAAYHRLVEANLRFVIRLAKRYANLGLPLPDLIQEGNLGLMRAARKFDHRRGLRFSTYAAWWIRHAIQRALITQVCCLSLPAEMVGLVQKIKRVTHQLYQELGREPTPEQIALRCDVNKELVHELIRALEPPIPLNMTARDDEQSALSETIEDREMGVHESEEIGRARMERLEQMFSVLKSRERSVIEMRYGLKDAYMHTCAEVGARLHLSGERVRQIEVGAMDKLRREAERHPEA